MVKPRTKPAALRALIVSGIALLLSCTLLGVIDLPKTPGARRAAAQRRWEARPFSAYQLALRVEYWNRVCFQEIEVQGERVRRIVSDTCRMSWFSSLTVPRLFEISERLEQAPTCYPDSQPCACRLVRIGTIEYDPQLGYPSAIDYRREVQPNWWHPDFWKRLWERKDLPSCGPSRVTRIVVSSFAPLP
jgi:hypothetical protein